MDSFKQSSGFQYRSDTNSSSGDSEFSGILAVFVHHARNIHNICIYDNQDVYAKFSLTYNPDETISTRIVDRGGKNPEFNESLIIDIRQIDAVLKCEIWMMSRARHCMEDQLLGFALVPVSEIAGKGKVTQDYSLSSTDLFHSPAGTIKLTLSLTTSVMPINGDPNSGTNPSIFSEIVLLDRKISEDDSDPAGFSRIEFPDINVVAENQQMVTEFFNGLNLRPNPGGGLAPFLHLGASHHPADDCQMTLNSAKENILEVNSSPNGSIQNSELLGSTTTSLSDDRNSSDSTEKKILLPNDSFFYVNECNGSSSTFPETPTSKKGIEARDEKESNFPRNDDKMNKKDINQRGSRGFEQVFKAPLGDMNLEAEQSAMQKQIVDMYMRSMQQFKESLSNMKLPMDLDKPLQHEEQNNAIQNRSNKLEIEKKKDGSRVFYGSRAFF